MGAGGLWGAGFGTGVGDCRVQGMGWMQGGFGVQGGGTVGGGV